MKDIKIIQNKDEELMPRPLMIGWLVVPLFLSLVIGHYLFVLCFDDKNPYQKLVYALTKVEEKKETSTNFSNASNN